MPDGGAPAFNWKDPDYLPVFRARAERLQRLRADRALFIQVWAYYKTHPADFINDWGMTFDQRVAGIGRSVIMPLVLFPKQREYLDWLYIRWRSDTGGTVVKSRDVGISWLTMAFACWMCIFHNDVSIGFGSEKEDKVDRSGDPDTLFFKGRKFMEYLPIEFRGGWSRSKACNAHMRMVFPKSGSSVTGEAGDNIGRGGRKALFAVDEAAHIPNPRTIDASLSANTECRIDMSSVCGMANSFAERAHKPSVARFDFAKEDDPRRDEAYWIKKREDLDPVIFAQEFDRDFTASVEGVVIPSRWVIAAINAHVVLGINPEGSHRGAMDVADSGSDANAFCVAHDFLVEHCETWKGTADLDIYHSVDRAFLLCDIHSLDGFVYDADGLGASVRGDARKINELRVKNRVPMIDVKAFRGSGEVFEPDKKVEGTERTALDFFENLKAQAWWLLRSRFQYTFRVIEAFHKGEIKVEEIEPGKLISIKRDFPERAKLCTELSQAVWATSKRGKIMVDKCPPGTSTEARKSISSPNLADSVMMQFAPRKHGHNIHPSLLTMVGASHVPQRR